MEDLGLVHRLERARDLHPDREHLVERERPAGLEAVAERPVRVVGGGDVRAAVGGVPVVEDGDDVRVPREAAGRGALPLEPAAQPLLDGADLQHLDRHGPGELLLVGAIHDAGAT